MSRREGGGMKQFTVGVVVGFIASSAVVLAAQSFDHNGVFWNKLNGAAKTGYVDGYGDAMQVSIGKLDSLTIAADLFHWKGADKIINQLSSELSTSEFGSDEAVRRLNALYADPKYSELDLGQALQLLSVKTLDENRPPPQPAKAQPTKTD
jgi:hypothetical protein